MRDACLERRRDTETAKRIQERSRPCVFVISFWLSRLVADVYAWCGVAFFCPHMIAPKMGGSVTDECIIMILGMTIIIIIVLFSFQIHISNQSTFTRQLIMNSLTLKHLIFSLILTVISGTSQNLSTSQFSQTIQDSIKSSLAFDENYVFSPFSLASQLLHIQHLMNAGA